MRLNIFENLTSPVDLSDRQYIEEQRERLVPLSLSPFKPSANGNPLQSDGAVEDSIATHNAIVSHDHLTIVDYHSTVSIDKDVPRGERPPAWLELSLDLAWTASFASLTANTKVEDAKSVSSYAVFFAIMWQLWADQITYDIQFYTNDWFHRLIFISQLGIYAGLSSFTNEFDILWGLKGKTVRYWRSDDDKLEYIRKANLSFDGISCVLAISRGLLIVQYMRVIMYRYKQKSVPRSLLLHSAVYSISSSLFMISCFLNRMCNTTRTASIIRLCLWTTAAAAEIAACSVSFKTPKSQLRGYGSLSARLSTLTVIVIGEGLSGICSTLKQVANAVGFGWKGIYQAFNVAMIIFGLWLLYFTGFRDHIPRKRLRKELWFLLHLPFHLSIILLLEVLKMTLLFGSYVISRQYMWKVYQSQLQNPDFATVISPEVASAWRQLDLSAKGHMQYIAEAKTDVRPQVWTWLEFQVSRLFVEPYSKLVGANQWVSPGRFEDPERRLSNQDLGISQRELGMTSTVVPIWEVSGWILPVTGCAIIMIGLFRYLQSRPQDKHLWACFFNKIIAGSLLISLAVVTEQRTIKYMPRLLSIYYLPLAGGIVIGVVVMDFILIYLFIRSTEKKRHAQTQEGDAGELHPLPRSDSIPHASETNPEIPNQAIPSTVSHNNDSGDLASSSDQSIQQHASVYKQYLVPFSSSPFKAGSGGQEDRDHTSYQVDNDDTPLGERPPNWLELSLDLAWSASFATLTTNTDFTYWRSLGSYAVFFSIMWQLWANQVTYDIQFYTNDWFHRLVFVSQLGIYAALASFNDKFDVLWRLRESGRSAGFFTLEDFHQMRLNSERKTDLSFDTISIILGISRTLLVVQYFRVIYYRYKQHSVSRSSVVVLAAFTTSSGLFFMSSSLNRIFQQQWVASVVRLILWTLAATIEITTHTLMSKVAKAKLRGYGSLSARLGTLTVIVIGEGLNGIYSALQEVVIEPGFGWRGIGQVISVASIIFCTWLLYFNGFRERLPATKLGKEVWFNLHLPFHLSIILLLEGLKVNLLSSCRTILLLDKGEGMPQDIMGLIRHKITPPMGLVWIFPVSGGTTLLTGLLGYILRQPQDKYAWSSFLSKIFGGTFLMCLITIDYPYWGKSITRLKAIHYLPIISGVIVGMVIIDFVVLYLFVRSARRHGSQPRPDSPRAESYPMPPLGQESTSRLSGESTRDSVHSATSVVAVEDGDS